MNPFAVDWDPDAEDDLARLWLQASDPTAVTRAQSEIDDFLARDPHANGSHVSEGLWRIVVPPLLANYTIDDEARSVQVTGLHQVS